MRSFGQLGGMEEWDGLFVTVAERECPLLVIYHHEPTLSAYVDLADYSVVTLLESCLIDPFLVCYPG